jgi:CheY-like chemotaxis protein
MDPQSRSAEPDAAARPRVLVVEDDDDLRDALVELLSGRGFDVRPASDGKQGLDQLRSWRPDLVVTDLGMPVLDGRSLRALQLEVPELASIPLIVVSGSAQQQEEAGRMRATAIVRKPFRAEELLSVVRSCLRR